MQISYQAVVVFVLYSLLMLAIGFYFYRNNETTEDYFLGDRSMGPVVSALSAGASDMSGWLLMGLPGALYVGGLINTHIAIGLTIGATINWILVAKRLRVYTSVIDNSITIPDYFETRFSDDKHILRLISAVVILIFFTFYVSSGLVSGAKLFEATFGVKYNHALITGTLIIVTYTFLGGYKAVCWTDLIQGLLMMGALVAVPCMMLYHLGGLQESFNIIARVKPGNLTFLEGSSLVAVISSLAWGLGYFGQPHILVRFMSIRSIKEIPQATTVGISWMGISLIGSCLIGLLGVAYVAKFHLSLADPEKIFIHMSETLFNPWISGVLLSAILAAVMSTASSQLLVSSSTIAEDFYSKIFNKEAPVKTVMMVSRASVLAVATIAFFISTDRNASVLKIVSYAWAGFGASFGTVILFSLFWARMTRLGAIAGMIFGASTVILYDKFGKSFLDIYEIVPGFLASSVAIVVFSLLSSVRPGTKDAFDLVMQEVKKGG
ncbi:sodium/proline symporter PutP [Helicobacter ailurogastricus]|uniref:Sodium/proline symporter n=1 Tax=Helicobacter ailurogastricus TaxID=1578720 RepID=A0A0K2X658_9HELI|nr:sodium/proline symporter PutP [Helicobacter ailurogastricus]CRF41063.1 Proline/sodium symporter PutP (TC 2.A.21.2.1) @ Propionate/sodium symporter [Helicobacter ailurogastricus]CRF42351.1 Proline/sodium symporter PutP (TC 2.A.21.2.1) @ Propionate/sodium symporter [Helicobacter ailurogastricus]CRF44751.1 Proline/sodium symporter PutP (TC 2.A.21.2.1) @ Propionate/sodium symporter [Helicobacter ailurogastricus]